MDIRKLKGIAVLSISTSEKLGQVEDLVFDATNRHIEAFKVASGGLLSRDHRWAPFNEVRSVGDDAVMVANERALRRDGNWPSSDHHKLGSLIGVKVVTEDGTYVGRIATAHVDPANGKVTEFEVGAGGVGGLFHNKTLIGSESVTSIGAKIMIVPATVVDATSRGKAQA